MRGRTQSATSATLRYSPAHTICFPLFLSLATADAAADANAMRLINTHTLELHWFQGRDVPAYAILSHTWEDEEIDFEQFTEQRDEPATRAKKGFVKIEQTCRLARDSGIDWAWVDTCCIDKRKSAELDEAINTMFRWYAESEVCFAYLSDLKPGGGLSFAKCRWFTRGWTLQELIAPRRLEFYNREWQCVGNKSLLGRELASITGIRSSVLRDPRWLQSISVAERMSWASGRQTTRVEDQAYCLLGIFGITMPLLYGEREKAFIRLQEEIIKETSDFSIFAWRVDADRAARQKHWGILAPSAREFAGWRDAYMPFDDPINANECITTSKGLRVTPVQGGGLLARPDGTYVMRLNCYYAGRRHDGQISVRLQKLGHAVYVRVRADELLTTPSARWEKTDNATFYIPKTVSPEQSERWAQWLQDQTL